ncbi:MAG: AAA family ATPase [Chloroflexota bacterium]|nr:AAA family ATPase [Chloroflexota bacterium]
MAAPVPAAEERKVVTVLFADLAGSTELAARLDPEDFRGVLRPFFEAMVEEIERFGGTIEKFIGDAIVGVFGVPAAHEDDPIRAVHAATAMQARLPALNERLASVAGGDLVIRVGVNTGDVLAAHHAEHEGYVVGEPVNVAARLQSLAAPGAIVVGERTWRYTRDAIAYRQLDDLHAKGISQPLAVWEVVADGGPSAGLRRFGSPLVARHDELELLRLLLSRTTTGSSPNLVTIVGPPGIGKSRLAWEFAEGVGGQSVRVVRGRCPPYGAGLAYRPLAEMLKADAGILDSDAPDVMLAKARAHLNPRFARAGDRLGTTQVLLSSMGIASEADPLAGSEPEAAKKLISGAWRRYFESMAAEETLIALIEDIHWADASLLDLIEVLAARVSGPLLLLCIARHELWDRRPAWSAGLWNTTTIALSPLSPSETTALIGEHLGGRMPNEVVNRIVDRSEGNPFFAGELLRMMVDDGTLERRSGSWTVTRELPSSLPDTVQGVIASRIDLLPPAQKRAIQDGAVVGRAFWQGAVARLGSSDPQAAVDALVDAGLVRERETSTIAGERELIFNHILTRDVAYAGVPRARRADAHAAVVTWVEEATSGRDEEFAEILSDHAQEAGDHERTARYSMLAGHRHRRVFAAEEAIRWYDKALAAIGALASDQSTLVLAEATLSRGEACEQLGRFAEAQADYEQALAAARAPGRPRLWLEARALAALVHVLWNQDRYEEGEAALPNALDAAERAGAEDITVRLLFTAGSMASGQGAWPRALSFHERALEVAQTSGDRESEALARLGLAETRLFTGPFDDGLRQGQRADALLRDLGQRPLVHQNEYVLAWHNWLVGKSEEAATIAAASLAGCREIADRRGEASALLVLGILSVSRGDLGLAARAGEEAVEVSGGVGVPRLELASRAWRMWTLAELRALGRLDDERRIAAALSDGVGGRYFHPPVLAARGWREAQEGDMEAARATFDEAARLGEGAPLQLVLAGRLELLCWEHLADADGLDRAARRLRDAAGSESPAVSAWAQFGLALADFLRGEHALAVKGAQVALDLAMSVPEIPIVWRSRVLLGRAYDELGAVDDAAAEIGRSAAILSPMVAGIEDDLRSTFLARPDVAQALRSGTNL